MRAAALTFALMAFVSLCAPLSAQAQTPAPAAPPATLPDLRPDAVTKPEYGYVPPTTKLEPGESSILSSEPQWAGRPRKSRATEAEAVFQSLPVEVQNMILTETQTVNNECHLYSTYAQFHDCECLGSVFFEERVLTPEETKDQIVARVSGECVSVPGLAGYGYDQCMSTMIYVLKDNRIEEYCKCFALEFAKGYEQSPYPDFDNVRAINGRAHPICIGKLGTGSTLLK